MKITSKALTNRWRLCHSCQSCFSTPIAITIDIVIIAVASAFVLVQTEFDFVGLASDNRHGAKHCLVRVVFCKNKKNKSFETYKGE